MRTGSILTMALLWAGAAAAQNFTTAAEVKPILDLTKGSWIAVREFEGNDLIYFTHLEAWRCGLSKIEYSVNGGAIQEHVPEICYEAEAQPNVLKIPDHWPYVTLPLNSVETVEVTVTYDDGSTQTVDFERANVLTP
ncbi:hypothetical protein [Tabrizicola sp.]|uniref:hypothetical protein n=1 Tax=Tabrizicola sp. TaxID=2005166 RepID=UPI00286D2E5D|nr:hypothetical protein [Tabrizicola sp.]